MANQITKKTNNVIVYLWFLKVCFKSGRSSPKEIKDRGVRTASFGIPTGSVSPDVQTTTVTRIIPRDATFEMAVSFTF